MNTANGMLQQEAPAPQKSKISKTVWYAGGGCLVILCCAAVIALAVVGYYSFFSGKDPIAAVVPGSSLMYMNVDFLQTQSDQFNKIVPIFQGIADVKKQPLADAMEETMQKELNLSFKNEVMPWMGQHGAFVVTTGDITSQEFEFMLIVEARDKTLADGFLPKFVAALESKNSGMKFDKKDVGGVAFYVYKSGAGSQSDMVVARSGSFFYFSNSEDSVTSSINLKSADSIANSAKYKEAMSVLPASRVASLYVNGEILSKYMADLSKQMGNPSLNQTANNAMSGVGMSMSLDNAGLRFDTAVAYDETKLGDFQKESLKATFTAPKADQLAPENTFFFLGVNSSQSPAKFMQDNNPVYTQDVKEALDLLEKQYNVSIKDLFNMLTGEFAVAMGPSNDGLLATAGQVNVGLTLFAATDNEAGFDSWAKSALDAISQTAGIPFSTTDAAVGGYNLKQVTAEGVTGEIMLYGAGKGYIMLGTSKDILEKGLSGSGTLANNAAYKDTWKAFPSKSVPYMYMNLSGLLDLYKSSAAGGSLGNAEADLRKIPVIAAAMNQNSGYVSSATVIMFINTK